MNTETPLGEKPDPPPTIWKELKGAGLHMVAAIAVLLFVAYALYVEFGPITYSKLGQFGDSFGALSSLFNALAFAALVATVVLQSRELRDSRRELAKQAKAQEAWANAAARQIELTKQLEAIRIRPFIKMEWHPREGLKRAFDLRVRNVGLGVAVLNSFELWAGEAIFGTVLSHGTAAAFSSWQNCLLHAAGSGAVGTNVVVETLPFNDLNRALAPGEFQAIVRVTFREREEVATGQFYEMRRNFVPVIHFRSADGKVLSTANQFSDFVAGAS